MLLKEVYVISDGLNLYHYSKGKDESDEVVKSTLTSGFLSALQTFSLEARESEIEYFASKNEYFLFTPLIGSHKMLICVFEKSTKREDSDNLLKQIRSILLKTHLVTKLYSNVVDEDKNSIVSDEINVLIEHYYSEKDPSVEAQTIFDGEPSISSLRVLDLEQKTILYENARPKPLLKENQTKELYLIVDSLDKLTERMNKPIFEFLTISCPGAFFTIFRDKKTVSLLFSSGIIDPTKLKERIVGLYNYSSYDIFARPYSLELSNHNYSVELNNDGDIVHQDGSLPTPMIEIFLSTLFNAINRLVSSHVRKSYSEVEIFIPSSERTIIRVSQVQGNHKVIFSSNE